MLIRELIIIVATILLLEISTEVNGKRFSSGSKSRGSSRGTSSSSSSGSGWSSWFGSSSKTTTHTSSSSSGGFSQVKPPDTNKNYGWTVPSSKPASNSNGWSAGSTGNTGNTGQANNKHIGWTVPNQNKPSNGWATAGNVGQTKPVGSQSGGWATAGSVGQTKPVGSQSGGWSTGQNKPVGPGNTNLPSSNIGTGGYPVQGGVNRNSPSHSSQGTSTFNNNQRASPPAYNHPPAYSAHDPMGKPPAYGSNYNKNYQKNSHTTNNYYYMSNPNSYGMSQQYYPRQNSFGYPAGYHNSGYQPSYHGMSLFSSGSHSYGYPGSGSWGVPSYGYGSGSSTGSFLKGAAIGAVGGYLTSSLINRVTNPWGYSGYGYGHGYMDRYRRYDYQNSPQPTPPPPQQSNNNNNNNMISCIAYDPESKNTLINPNCTCTFIVTTDPATGQNNTQHNCVPKYINGYLLASNPATAVQAPIYNGAPQTNPANGGPGMNNGPQVYGVNNPPPGFNGTVGGVVGAGGGYGASYGYNQGTPNEPQITAQSQQQIQQVPISNSTQQQKFYSDLETFVNMGHFN